MQVHWHARPASAVTYAAAMRHWRHTLTDAGWQRAIDQRLAELPERVPPLAASLDLFWHHTVPQSAQNLGHVECARVVLRKCMGTGDQADHVSALANWYRELHASSSFDQDAGELELRARPVRALWEAHGPGLLHFVGRVTDPSLLVEQSSVYLIPPVTGGGGMAHLATNAITWEAVLANPMAELPEVIRVGWLMALLHSDLPRFSDNVSTLRLHWIAGLAMIPPILQAAEYVELVRFERSLLQPAIQHWIVSPLENSDEVADATWNWWQTYQSARPDWSVALSALDRMLGDVG